MFFDNLLKCAIILLGLSQLASCANFRCYKSITDYKDVDVNKAEELSYQSNAEYFDINKSTYMYAHGFNGQPEDRLSKALISALMALAGAVGNVVLVDWSKEAETNEGRFEIFQLHFYVIPNVEIVGRQVGKALAKLTKLGLKNDIHIVGFGYGAHLAGYAGRESANYNVQLREIVALDPTEYGFSKISAWKSVDKTCASLVSVYHTDVGGYGVNRTLGDVDFWPNFGQYASAKSVRRQPGCDRSSAFWDRVFGGNYCSHERSVEICVESLSSPFVSFKGGKAENYNEFLKKNGIFDNTNFIGPRIDYNNSGDFFLTTNEDSPYGRGNMGLK